MRKDLDANNTLRPNDTDLTSTPKGEYSHWRHGDRKARGRGEFKQNRKQVAQCPVRVCGVSEASLESCISTFTNPVYFNSDDKVNYQPQNENTKGRQMQWTRRFPEEDISRSAQIASSKTEIQIFFDTYT